MRINLTALSELYELARKELSSAYDNGETITYLTMYLPPILDLELLKVSGPRFFSSKKPLSKASLILEISSFLKSSNSESEYSISLDFIHDAIERLKECTLNDLASMLELFFISALQFREDPPPLSHSDFITVPQRCQHCKREGTYLSWRMINTELREDLHQKVTTGKVFDNHCYYCGHYIPYTGPLFYCNPNRSEYLLFCPPLNERGKRAIQDEISNYLKSLPGEFRENKEDIAFVSQYISGSWRGTENCNMVFYVHDKKEFLGIVNASEMQMTIITDPLTVAWAWQENLGFTAFSNKDYKLAVSMYAKAFLEKQHSFKYLTNIAAALSELKQDEEARFLRKQATLLKMKLKEEGIVRDVRSDAISNIDVDSWIGQSREIEQNGLPTEWGFEQLIATVRRLEREYDRD